MKKKHLIPALFFAFCSSAQSQSLNQIFTNVDTLHIPGAGPGSLLINNTNVIPIVSGSPCENELRHYSVTRKYQNGKVIAIGHEGLIVNNSIGSYNNLTFLLNVMDWLNPGNKRITLKEGWVGSTSITTLQSSLATKGYTFSTLSGSITTASLANTDILLFGNDWNNTQPYTTTELAAIENFVANGGSVFIAGLGWSWPQALNLYPMNQVATMFGFQYTTEGMPDAYANVNGAPKFYNFYPENIDTTINPHCPAPFFGTNIPRGDTLRVLRAAISSTGEFTQLSGGVTNTAVLIEQWLSDINDIYGREYCTRFELIPNNNQLIFANAATDPWPRMPPGSFACVNSGTILSQQPNVIDGIIGAANYDISHVIVGPPYSGGCAGSLKNGMSGGLNHSVSRHEMGHQFTQRHTINHTGKDNFEAENGNWTIQGGNANGYAHGVSYHQLAAFLKTIPTAGIKVPTGNTIPTIYVGPDVVIPISTPFTINAASTDPDTGDSLTYVFDNMSRGIPQFIPVIHDTVGALFMRLLPDTSSSRTFPKMSDVIANNNVNAQEQLPTRARIMDIRVTVNDNHKMTYKNQLINASGINSDDIMITVAPTGPFEVTSQSTTGIIYPGGTNQFITWSVNGTDTMPINTKNVAISLSVDGGYTYPYLLKGSTPNNGSASVTLPNISASNARIKVAANNSIYFDINTADFKIEKQVNILQENAEWNNVSVYPNPAANYFIVEPGNLKNFRIRLYDVNSKLLSEQANKTYYDIADLSKGLYIIEITDLKTQQRVNKKLAVL